MPVPRGGPPAVAPTRSPETHRRNELLEAAYRYVLTNGIGQVSLRPLAHALGTSDRMILYYFGTKERLIDEVLDRAAGDLVSTFESRLSDAPVAPREVLRAAAALAGDERTASHVRLWLEVVMFAGRGDPRYAATARRVVTAWTDHLAAHLDVPAPDRRRAAAGLLAVIDGLMVLYAAGAEGPLADAFTWLQRLQ